jgi:iron(III) transport system permease protein
MVSATRSRAAPVLRPSRASRSDLLPLIGVGVTLALIFVPLATMILFSFRSGSLINPGPFGLINYLRAYGDPTTYAMLGNTALVSVLATALSCALAIGFAFLIERTDMPLRHVAWVLMLIPLALPGVLFAVSWTFLLSPRIGLFNLWLRDLLGLFVPAPREGPFNIYSLSGMIFLEGLRGTTAIFLMIVAAFRAMDPTLEEAARMSGASGRRIFLRVFLPMMAPAILGAAIYSLMSHLESLEIPLVVGLPAQIFVLPSFIYFSTQRFAPPQYGIAASLGSSFVMIGILLVFFYRKIGVRAGRYTTITGKSYKPRRIALGPWRYACLGLFALYFVLTIAAPVLILLWTSLLPTYIPPTNPGVWARLSLINYRTVLADASVWAATLNSVWVALSTATLTLLLALVAGWATMRSKRRGRAILDTVTFLPHALPGVVIGIAFIYLSLLPPFDRLGLYGSLWLVTLGLAVSSIAFASRAINAALAQLHADLEEAAKTAGAGWFSVMRRVTFPLLLPAFVSAFIWVAMQALRNLSIPIMLVGRDNEVLSVIMWQSWDDGYPGRTCALGMLLIVLLVALASASRIVISRGATRETG